MGQPGMTLGDAVPAQNSGLESPALEQRAPQGDVMQSQQPLGFDHSVNPYNNPYQQQPLGHVQNEGLDPRHYQRNTITGRMMDVVAGHPIDNDNCHAPQPGNFGAPVYPVTQPMHPTQPAPFAQHQPHYGMMGRESPPRRPSTHVAFSASYRSTREPSDNHDYRTNRRPQELGHFGPTPSGSHMSDRFMNAPAPYQPAPYHQQNSGFGQNSGFSQSYSPNTAPSMGMGERELLRPTFQQPPFDPNASVIDPRLGNRPALMPAPNAYGQTSGQAMGSYPQRALQNVEEGRIMGEIKGETQDEFQAEDDDVVMIDGEAWVQKWKWVKKTSA